jgi:chromosome segregation ATPase
MRIWAWISIGLSVVVLAVLIYPLIQIQKELRLVESALGRANEQVVQARAGMAELERVVANLKTELDAANRARTQLQGGFDEANSELEKRQSEVERLSAELEKATQTMAQANAKATELEETAANITKDAEAERSKLQAALDQANTEVERLKIEVQQREAVPSQGNSVSEPSERESGVGQ